MRCSESGGLYVSLSGPADLKGKSIAVTRFGSLTDLALRPVLEKWKIGTQERCQSGSNWSAHGYRTGNSTEESSRKDAFVSHLSSSGEVGLKTLYDLSESDIEVPTTTVAVSPRTTVRQRYRTAVSISTIESIDRCSKYKSQLLFSTPLRSKCQLPFFVFHKP